MYWRDLPKRPELERLRGEARDLYHRARAGDRGALALIRDGRLSQRGGPSLSAAAARDAVAGIYGFDSWSELTAHVALVTQYSRWLSPDDAGGDDSDRLVRLACLNYASDGPERWRQADALLARRPGLAGASMHAGAAAGDAEAVVRLLDADPEAVNRPCGPHQWEPILYACYSRLPGGAGRSTAVVVSRLLERGADPNAGFLWQGSPPPFTALTGAFGYGEDAPNQPPHDSAGQLAVALLEFGADPNDEQVLYNSQWRPDDAHLEILFSFGLGRGNGGPWHLRLAPKHCTPSQMTEDHLRSAIAADRLERVELMVRHGVAVDGRGSPRRREGRVRAAWELALVHGATRVAARLPELGAAVTALDPVDELLAAAMAGQGERVDTLLSQDRSLGAAARAREPGHLAEAAGRGQAGAVLGLVRAGFDVNAKLRATALHAAAWAGDHEMVDLLFDLGADPTIRDDAFGATAVGWAEHAHHDRLAEYLRERETEPNGERSA